MEPASSIIESLGGPNEVARITGAHRTRVSNWKRAKEKGGCGGFIPRQHWDNMIAAAGARGIVLTPESFVRAADPVPAPESPAEPHEVRP